jgi:hypothetical protein
MKSSVFWGILNFVVMAVVWEVGPLFCFMNVFMVLMIVFSLPKAFITCGLLLWLVFIHFFNINDLKNTGITF